MLISSFFKNIFHPCRLSRLTVIVIFFLLLHSYRFSANCVAPRQTTRNVLSRWHVGERNVDFGEIRTLHPICLSCWQPPLSRDPVYLTPPQRRSIYTWRRRKIKTPKSAHFIFLFFCFFTDVCARDMQVSYKNTFVWLRMRFVNAQAVGGHVIYDESTDRWLPSVENRTTFDTGRN